MDDLSVGPYPPLKRCPAGYTGNEFESLDQLESINLVSKYFCKYNGELVGKQNVVLSQIINSICVMGSKVLKQTFNLDNIPDVKEQTSILSLIKKHNNENLHSDFIAALLDPAIMGQFANKFFIRLVACQSNLKNNEVKTNTQKAYREVRLDSISSEINDPNLGAKRIDILVETESHVLIIENKVYTFESENQTKDYYRWTKSGYEEKDKRKGITTEVVPFFLSPSGMPASSSRFINISYFDLYEFIIELDKYCISTGASRELLEFYKKELENTILLSQINAINYSSNFLREKGYDT